MDFAPDRRRGTRGRAHADNAAKNIGVLGRGGYADAAAQDRFCANTTCLIARLYDLVVTTPVTTGSSPTDKRDATWVQAPGLANQSCISFESVNKPGSYLRHANFQLHLQPNDGSALFAQDATFCPQPGNSGQGTSFQSVNFPDRYLRTFTGTVYLASNGGPNPWDATDSWAADSSWLLDPPWTPAP